jgi:tetratricopeptide (TPR) repeat protein
MKQFRKVLGIAVMAGGIGIATGLAQTSFDSPKADKAEQKMELKQPKWDAKVDKADIAEKKAGAKQPKWDSKADKAEQKMELKQPKWNEKVDKVEQKRMWPDQASIGKPVLVAQDFGQIQIDSRRIKEQADAAMKASQKLATGAVQQRIIDSEQQILAAEDKILAAEAVTRNLDIGRVHLDMDHLNEQMREAQRQLELAGPAFDNLRASTLFDAGGSLSGLALAFQQGVGAGVGRGGDQAARDAAERAREVRERQRDAAERLADNEQRKIDLYREGTGSVDDGRYEQAVSRFNRLLEADSKWSRADGAYYWKAYALNKLGKRDEALSTLGEIAKQFPQSKWINDAKALQVEVQQSAGRPVSPDSIDDQDLKLLALTALMNSDSERAVPLVDGVLKDPKNNLSLKAKALYVLAQRPNNEKAREIVGAYAKNGSNPDLQIRAVGYVGTWRTKDGSQILADIYAANSDVAVKRAVLRALSNSRDSARLFGAVKSEQNADLRREAIRGLGNMQAANELAQLYATETATDLKDSILASMMNARATDKLIEIAKTEKNTELRGDAIRYLSNTRGDKTAEALVAIYGSESDKNVKAQILRALANQGAGKQLVEILRNEKDAELKASGVRMLGQIRNSKEASDYLMEIISK